MSSIESTQEIGDSDARLLAEHGTSQLRLARESIAWYARTGTPPAVDPALFPPALRAQRAVFVTLTQGGDLRGCVGTPIAWRSLVEDVVDNAVAAAFEDRRFPPLSEDEVTTVEISISLLGEPTPFEVGSEVELLAQLRPSVDGLLMRAGSRQALFLPQVWKDLPDPREFLARLKMKAGLPEHYWSPSLVFHRFTSSSVSDR